MHKTLYCGMWNEKPKNLNRSLEYPKQTQNFIRSHYKEKFSPQNEEIIKDDSSQNLNDSLTESNIKSYQKFILNQTFDNTTPGKNSGNPNNNLWGMNLKSSPYEPSWNSKILKNFYRVKLRNRKLANAYRIKVGKPKLANQKYTKNEISVSFDTIVLPIKGHI